MVAALLFALDQVAGAIIAVAGLSNAVVALGGGGAFQAIAGFVHRLALSAVAIGGLTSWSVTG